MSISVVCLETLSVGVIQKQENNWEFEISTHKLRVKTRWTSHCSPIKKAGRQNFMNIIARP